MQGSRNAAFKTQLSRDMIATTIRDQCPMKSGMVGKARKVVIGPQSSGGPGLLLFAHDLLILAAYRHIATDRLANNLAVPSLYWLSCDLGGYGAVALLALSVLNAHVHGSRENGVMGNLTSMYQRRPYAAMRCQAGPCRWIRETVETQNAYLRQQREKGKHAYNPFIK